MTDQKYITWYFSNCWKPQIQNYVYSGPALIDKIGPEEWVLDVGCGDNYFKNKIKNLVGIDPAFDQADYKCTIEEFIPDRLFDAAFCLGSINFGTEQDIEDKISLVIKCLAQSSRIYWRCNPGQHDHISDAFKEIQVFPWTFDHHKKFAKKFGYEVRNAAYDTNGRAAHVRLYAEWHRA